MSFHDGASSPAESFYHNNHDSTRDSMTQMAAKKDGKPRAIEKRKQRKSAKPKSSEPAYKSAEFIQESSDEEGSESANTRPSNTNQKQKYKSSDSILHDRRDTTNGATRKTSKRRGTGNSNSNPLNTKPTDKSIELQRTHVKSSRPNGALNGISPSSRRPAKIENDTGSESGSAAVGAHPGRESDDDEDEGDQEVEDVEESINGLDEGTSGSEEESEPGSEEGLLDLEAEEATEEEEEDEEEDQDDQMNEIGTARKEAKSSLHKQKSGRSHNLDVVSARSEGDDAGDDSSEDSSTSGNMVVRNRTETSQAREETVTDKTRGIPDYIPPDGFSLNDIAVSSTSETQNLLSTDNLEGKEIWYLTAPSSVPISSLEQLSPQNIADGSQVLSHDGKAFGIVSYKAGLKQSHTVLTPQVPTNEFKGSVAAVSKALRMQQIFDVPIRSTRHESTGSQSAMQMPTFQNEQPPLVKMRSHGFGIPGCTLSESDPGSEGSGTEPISSAKDVPPLKPLPPSNKKKRKHSDVDPSTAVAVTTSSSPKKSKTVTSSKTAMMPPTPESTNTPFYTPKEQPDSIDPNDRATHTPVTGSSAITPGRSETKEERQRRRGEEHQKKLRKPFRVPRSSSPAKKHSVAPNGTDNEQNHSEAVDGNAKLQSQPATSHPDSKAFPASSPPRRDFISASKLNPTPGANVDLPAKENDKSPEQHRARKAEKRRKKKEHDQQTESNTQAVSSSPPAPVREEAAIDTGSSFSPQIRSPPPTQPRVPPDPKRMMDVDPPSNSGQQDRHKTSDEAELRKAEKKRRKEERRRQKETTADGTIPSKNEIRSPPNPAPPQKSHQKSQEKHPPKKGSPQPETAREKHVDPVSSNGIAPNTVASSDKKSNITKPRKRKAAKQAAKEEERQQPHQPAAQSPTDVLPSLRGLFDPSNPVNGTPATNNHANQFQTPLSVSGLNFRDIFNKNKQNGVASTNGLTPQTSFEQQTGNTGMEMSLDGAKGKEASEGKVKRKEKRKRKSEEQRAITKKGKAS